MDGNSKTILKTIFNTYQNATKIQANGMSAAATKLSNTFIAGLSTSVIFQIRFAEPLNDSGEDITIFSDFSLLMFLFYL